MKAASKKQAGKFPGLRLIGQRLYISGRSYWAGWMEEKASGLSKKQLYVALTGFIAVAGAYCIFLVYQGISGGSSDSVGTGRIRYVRTEPAAAIPHDSRPGNEFLKIKAFRNYIDSLDGTVQGRKIRDSIMQARPGLLDSIAAAEAYFKRN